MTATTTTKPARAPRKTGNPATDRAARAAAARPTTKPAPKAAEAPKPAPAPKPDVREAKQALARLAVQAYADSLAGRPAEDKQTAANWIHHLPTGQENGARWWPANLPRPQRSDWR